VDEAGVKEDAFGGGGLAGVMCAAMPMLRGAPSCICERAEFTALFSTALFSKMASVI